MGSGLSGVLKKAVAMADNSDATKTPQETQQLQMEAMMTFMTKCCGAADQNVFGTLVPTEPPEAADSIKQLCAAGGPPPSFELLSLIGVPAGLNMVLTAASPVTPTSSWA